ncbi:AAA family ATPase [Desulfococcaceae bacterium HSG8]|nr:AAA family ATPase [Desulfococcaceae bacterium HSG8]
MKINRLEIENFRGIREMEIDFDPRLNVFTGVNGAGKSSIVHCLAILISRLTWRIVSGKNKGRLFTEDDIHLGEKNTKSTIHVEIKNKNYNWTAGKSLLKGRKPTLTNQSEIKGLVASIHDDLDENFKTSIPLATLYSTNRSAVKVPLRVKKKHLFDQLAALEDSLSEERKEADFKLFFEWFRNREDVENENRRYLNDIFKPDDFEFPDRQLSAVRNALGAFMPKFSDLQVRRKPKLRMIVKKNDSEFSIEQLSDGEKCLIALVGDIARRLAVANPSLDDPLQGKAVILIDEIDLHLHPSWQRMIVPGLLDTFPNSQFIITTHSPQILGETDARHIFLLYQDEQNQIVCSKPSQAMGLTTNGILEELMRPPGSQESLSRNNEVEEKLNKIFMLIDKEQFIAARKLINRLKQEIHGDIPDLVRAESLLAMLEDET